ncbi:MAG: pathogenesis-related genes transcriptional activator [Trebouxia sp. A1-2]|nr:MAG: pathogenesis-related genes transcriptional activator [Trebouxia sp. A1-2]
MRKAASLAYPSGSSTTSADRAGQAVSDHSLSFTSSASLYDSIPEYFRQHMEPPQDLMPPASQPVPTLNPPPTADISGAYRSLRSASASRKPDRANSLLDEFAAEELQTLSTLLPATASGAPEVLPGDERTASPASHHLAQLLPHSLKTLSSSAQSPDQGPQAEQAPSGLEDVVPEADAMNEDDSSKHVSSTFRGVYKRKFDTKWRAEITAGRRKRCLGSFASEREAAEAYDKAALTLRGPAAFTNFPANHYASISTRNEPVKGRSGLALKDRRFMGVTWCTSSQQFEARIWTRTGEEHQLVGMFETPEAAAHAYDQAALKMHGPEAYTNFLLKPEAGGQRGAGGSGPRHVPSAGGTGLTVTVKASALNKAPTGKGSSKFRGVSWHKDNMKWRATIFKGSKPVHIGYFDSQQDAARAYDQEAIRLRGPNTSLNYPITDYDVGAPEPELDEDVFSPPGSSFSPSPSPRGLLPEGSFVDESGRVLGPEGSSPMGTLGAPRLDARLVAVFSPRSLPTRPGSAAMTTQPEGLDHGSRAGSEPHHNWASGQQGALGPSGADPPAPSLQALMQTNPDILKTIQVNEPQEGAVSKRGRALTKSASGLRAEASKGASTSRGRPPLSRQASRLHTNPHDYDISPAFAAGPALSPALSPLDEEDQEAQAGPSSAGFNDQHDGPVDLLAAAAATLAGCKKDKQGLLPMWGHKGKRSQGHDVSPLSEEPEYDAPRMSSAGRSQVEQSSAQTRGEGMGRNLRPRSAKRPRSS